jgi:hypothetical protein
MQPVPADGLLHPMALCAIGFLLLNDHVLKAVAPSPITGKLSDIAGLAFFPLVLVGIWEVAAAVRGRWIRPGWISLTVSIAVTAVVFTLVKTTSEGSFAFGWTIGGMQWPVVSAVSILVGQQAPPLVASVVVTDPTDLVALPALVVSALVGSRRLRPLEPQISP